MTKMCGEFHINSKAVNNQNNYCGKEEKKSRSLGNLSNLSKNSVFTCKHDDQQQLKAQWKFGISCNIF